MPTPTFKRITLEQFAQLVRSFPFTRRITQVHMHHTWRPSHREFDGHRSIVAMWRFHTQQGWSDIAQHVTIDPEGYIWLGRNWNQPPASARGYNGNHASGPFMFEMVGDFDRGHDAFAGAQRETVLQVIALVQARFDLPASTLVFHRSMSRKSCPGDSIDYDQVVAEVARRREQLASQPRGVAEAEGPFPQEEERDLAESIHLLDERAVDTAEPADAELDEGRGDVDRTVQRMQAPDAWPGPPEASERGSGLDAETLARMRPHLVNLRAGRFSGGGETRTTPQDVDAMFEQHLPEAIARATAQRRKLPIVFYAHGGLVSEGSGLQIASRHLAWWKDNGVYPIYLIWETGGLEAVGQLLQRAWPFGRRGLADVTSDPLIERAVRALNGDRVWNSMKYAAEHAVDAATGSDPGGGARYMAERLAALCRAHGDAVELHAVGHSAGSIFHSHFLPCAHELKVPVFRSLHFMAPAVRIDTFKRLLKPLIDDGRAVESLTLYTMKRDYERRDNCAWLYRKSLLYLIHFALERERRAPILGLEDSLRADAELKKLFGLDGSRQVPGEIVWSVSDTATGCSASTSVTHGGFDDDAPTMESILRRVLHKADADAVVPFPKPRGAEARERPWTEEIDWPDDLPPRPAAWQGATGAEAANAPSVAAPAPQAASRPSGQRIQRLALCVGIDHYPDPRNELAGCVADAQLWAAALAAQGFEPTLLLDGQATRAGIEQALRDLLARCRAGDVAVFQYAGHGTLVPDLDGDEDAGADDQALCPVDFETGALFLDDDLAEVLAGTRDGVALTCFMDCCHSGSIIRFGVGPDASTAAGRDDRARFIKASPELIEAHRRFRRTMAPRGLARGRRGGLIRHVSFAACQDNESAWESNGHGEFTVHATGLLQGDVAGLSNAAFDQRVQALFGSRPRQTPQLYCDEPRRAMGFLQPLVAATAWAPAATAAPSREERADIAELVANLSRLTSVLQQTVSRLQ